MIRSSFPTACLLALALTGVAVQAAGAAEIYRCDGPDGPVFSDTPCGESAALLDVRFQGEERSEPRGSVDETADDAPPVPLDRVEAALFRTPEEVRELLGLPAAAYVDGEIRHWFYPNIERRSPSPSQPEVRFEGGRLYEVVWHAPETMQRLLPLARSLARWEAPRRIRDKPFASRGLSLRGAARDAVEERLGRPDSKRIRDGRERWRYEQVPTTPEAPATGTLTIDFADDAVVAVTVD